MIIWAEGRTCTKRAVVRLDSESKQPPISCEREVGGFFAAAFLGVFNVLRSRGRPSSSDYEESLVRDFAFAILECTR